MKRRFSKYEWAKYQKRHRQKLEDRRLRATDYRSRDRPPPREPVRFTFEGKLDPVEDSATVVNCERIRNRLRNGHPVFIDISRMTEFTLAGAMYLAASLEHSNGHPLVSGNLPTARVVASEFLKSGFFENFTMPGRRLPPAQGSWRRHKQEQVTAQVAAELVRFADARVGLRPEQGKAISQNLVECMTNTRNHATLKEEIAEPWIAGVWCNKNIAYFAFVDKGVGICGSTEARTYLKYMKSSVMGFGPSRLVRAAFTGALGSSTDKMGRGLGLPRMRQDATSGLLQDLCVRTGKAMGQVNVMAFRNRKDHLQGTVITWRVVGTKGQDDGASDDG